MIEVLIFIIISIVVLLVVLLIASICGVVRGKCECGGKERYAKTERTKYGHSLIYKCDRCGKENKFYKDNSGLFD